MRKYTTAETARKLERSEATVRGRTDLPVVEVIGGQRFFDADKIDLLQLTKAMGLGETLEGLSPSTIAAKFADVIEQCDPARRGELLSVTEIVLRGASDADRARVATAVTKAIRRAPVEKAQNAGNVEKLMRRGNV
ncbi:MAG TPA: hypothetical protein VGY48_30370 [Vicinamibacterales bacterium]|nr:hypothetical protein [Vicinamibacterales bacterium]